MAVYTKLKKENIEEILSNYSIGSLKEFKGIEEGIENTNYFLIVDSKKYILTIYEKRVREKDLPFFSQLMSSLNKSGFRCPVPIESNNKKTIINFYFMLKSNNLSANFLSLASLGILFCPPSLPTDFI